MRTRWLYVPCMVVAATLTGCLGEPEVQERWTNLEFLAASTGARESWAVGDTVSADLRSRVTFRGHFIGFLVAEVRVSHTLTPDSLFLDDVLDPVAASVDVGRLLARSQPVARTVKGMAGYPSLRRTLETELVATVPAMVSGTFDRPGGTPRGLFLVLYMGDGEEVRLEGGRDSLVVTPFDTHDDEVLFKAIALPMTDEAVTP